MRLHDLPDVPGAGEVPAARETMTGPTFGQFLRGARLGFMWCREVRAMMRLSGDGPFIVELCPPACLPNGGRGGLHRVWWEKDRDAIVGGILPLKRIKAVKKPVVFLVGEDGELLR